MKLSVIIPSYNEARSIASVVRNLNKVIKKVENSFEIIVVDNGSTDETALVLDSLKKEIPSLATIRVFPNQGYGNGILTGLAATSGEVLGWIHADNQAKAEDVIDIYKKLLDENLDFCKATRVIRNENLYRIVQSKAYNTFFRLLFSAQCGDINGSPKLFRRSLYEAMQPSSKDWFIDPEIMIKAIRLKAKIGEVEIHWKQRLGGRSKVGLDTTLEFIKNIVAYKFFNKI